MMVSIIIPSVNSLALILNNVGVEMSQPVPQSYIDKNNKLAAEQLVIASIRLAMVIEKIFGASSAVEEQKSFLQ